MFWCDIITTTQILGSFKTWHTGPSTLTKPNLYNCHSIFMGPMETQRLLQLSLLTPLTAPLITTPKFKFLYGELNIYLHYGSVEGINKKKKTYFTSS